jgi:hypothetical protein
MTPTEFWSLTTAEFPRATIFYGNDWESSEKAVTGYFEDHCSDFVKLDKPKVEELKNLTHWISLHPAKKYKVVQIAQIDEVSKEATNYLLKTIEDSPPYLRWVMYSQTKDLNPALISRSMIVPVFRNDTTIADMEFFANVKDLSSAYMWLVNTKESSSETEFRNRLIDCCDSIAMNLYDFQKIHLCQRYKNLLKRESTGFDSIFKSLLVQVFDAV